MITIDYPAIVERGSSGFGVFFPDLPGCVSVGDTVEEAVRNAEEALRDYLLTSVEYGDVIASPGALDAIVVDADIEEVTRILVRAEVVKND